MNEDVHLTIEIAARPATVYRFLTDPEWFRRWMGAASSMSESPEGGFRVVYPNGDNAIGRIVEKVEGRRVVYSWGYQDDKHGVPAGSTRVAFDLEESPTGTVLVLRHQGLPTPKHRENHRQGWMFYAAQLASSAATAQIGGTLQGSIAAYVGSWNEADHTQRAQLLEQAVEHDVVYRDRMALVRGRTALIAHIAGTRAFAPALKLELVGAPRQSHQFAAFDWRIVDAAGSPFATGSCFGDLSLDGKFRSVIGFWNS
jgi:uncharacterized protein YndB with AHSA1/START domain